MGSFCLLVDLGHFRIHENKVYCRPVSIKMKRRKVDDVVSDELSS